VRRAKIVCTIGPATASEEMLLAIASAGMDVARLNMSHNDHAWHGAAIDRIRRVSRATGREIAILLDLAGPKIRVGELAAPMELKKGQLVRLVDGDRLGEGDLIPVRYAELSGEMKPGDALSMADGLIRLTVVRVEPGEVTAKVESGATLLSRKGVNLPTGGNALAAMTGKDEADLRFGLSKGVDWVSLSFVRLPTDAEGPRAVMESMGQNRPLMAKIERRQALENLPAIIESFDGLMVARGDLGVEVSLEELPALQKRIIRAANRAAKPVVTATQMLLSMVENPRPTRAEATDVANAILDGTDAVMLSEETAMGSFPAEAVAFMAAIAGRTVPDEEEGTPARELTSNDRAIARATMQVAEAVGASLIIAPTARGDTPRLLSSARPSQPILAVGEDEEVLKRLAFLWGVTTRVIAKASSTDELFKLCRDAALKSGLGGAGGKAVVTAGVPLGSSGTTNMLKIVDL